MTYREMINEIMERDPGVAMAGKIVLEISRDEEERARLMSEYKYVVDTQSKVVHARREGRKEGMQKGIQEGWEQGIQEGLEKGIQEGREQGIQEGREQGIQEGLQQGIQKGIQEGGQKKTVEFARKLKSCGVAAEQIAEYTGLSLQQIEGL